MIEIIETMDRWKSGNEETNQRNSGLTEYQNGRGFMRMDDPLKACETARRV